MSILDVLASRYYLQNWTMCHTSFQVLVAVTCWYLSTPVLPVVVRRSTGESMFIVRQTLWSTFEFNLLFCSSY